MNAREIQNLICEEVKFLTDFNLNIANIMITYLEYISVC